MENKKLTMHLKVAGKKYGVNTTPDKEEAYRLAEQEVNNLLESFKRGKYKGFEDRDYLAMVALHLAIGNVQMRQSREVGGEDLRMLDEMNNRLDRYLNEPNNE